MTRQLILVSILGAAALTSCENTQQNGETGSALIERELTLAEIVQRNTQALGGAAALDAIDVMVKKSRVIEGEYDDETIFAVDRAGRMRVDIYANGDRVFAESFDGESGRQWRPNDGQSATSEKGAIALSHTPQLPNHIFRLKDLAANGHQLTLLGEEEIEGENHHVLELTLSDGFQTFLFANAESGFVTRARNQRALHVDIDDNERVIEARMSDFRPVGDIKHPHRVEEVDLKSGETLVEITLLSLNTNTELPDGYYRNLVNVVPEFASSKAD